MEGDSQLTIWDLLLRLAEQTVSLEVECWGGVVQAPLATCAQTQQGSARSKGGVCVRGTSVCVCVFVCVCVQPPLQSSDAGMTRLHSRSLHFTAIARNTQAQ